MPTETELRLARYTETRKEADALGRIIEVRRLKPSEQTKLVGMTPELGGHEEVTDQETGTVHKIPSRMPMQVAAAVCKIDNIPIPFPRNRGELDAIYDRLDVEGIEAALRGLSSLNPKKDLAEEGEPADPLEEAKNSQGTPSSG